MRISDLGEFGLIELVQEWTRDPERPDQTGTMPAYETVVDNGDDTAAVTFVRSHVTELYTTDTMVEGVHFTPATTPWRDLGWKAIASNVSDVAAMGGKPALALVTLGLPPDALVDDVRDLYSGMSGICGEFGVHIVGGDMVRSPVAFVTVALTGIAGSKPMVRMAAEPGHLVGVTGPLGGSAGGLRVLLEGAPVAGPVVDQLTAMHRRPLPHVEEGQILAANGVGCAMDVSDGLADDLAKLCTASGVAANLRAETVPVPESLESAFPGDWIDLALYGGEDYVLLFTAPPHTMRAAMDALPGGAAVVGEIIEGPTGTVTVLDRDGSPRPRKGAGWDHFG